MFAHKNKFAEGVLRDVFVERKKGGCAQRGTVPGYSGTLSVSRQRSSTVGSHLARESYLPL